MTQIIATATTESITLLLQFVVTAWRGSYIPLKEEKCVTPFDLPLFLLPLERFCSLRAAATIPPAPTRRSQPLARPPVTSMMLT